MSFRKREKWSVTFTMHDIQLPAMVCSFWFNAVALLTLVYHLAVSNSHSSNVFIRSITSRHGSLRGQISATQQALLSVRHFDTLSAKWWQVTSSQVLIILWTCTEFPLRIQYCLKKPTSGTNFVPKKHCNHHFNRQFNFTPP